METLFFVSTQQHMNDEGMKQAGTILKEGGLVAFPTETVYGLGGDALNPGSSQKIYSAKGRPSDNPLIVHIADMEALPKVAAKIPEAAVKLAAKFWPGPLTMIFEKTDAVPYETTGGLETVAVRMPSHEVALRLIREGGGYIAAPSANTSGKPSPTTAADVAEDMDGKIDCIIDGGAVGIGIESTIIDLTVTPPQILRPGFITQAMLSEVLGEVDSDRTMYQADTGTAPRAPGMKYRHYAPKGSLAIVDGDRERVVDYINRAICKAQAEGKKCGVIATEETKDLYCADVVLSAGTREDEESIARHLYGCLREFDRQNAEILFSESFEAPGLLQAVMNRLLKAAGHQIIKA